MNSKAIYRRESAGPYNVTKTNPIFDINTVPQSLYTEWDPINNSSSYSYSPNFYLSLQLSYNVAQYSTSIFVERMELYNTKCENVVLPIHSLSGWVLYYVK